jgi:hypothetical protein
MLLLPLIIHYSLYIDDTITTYLMLNTLGCFLSSKFGREPSDFPAHVSRYKYISNYHIAGERVRMRVRAVWIG